MYIVPRSVLGQGDRPAREAELFKYRAHHSRRAGSDAHQGATAPHPGRFAARKFDEPPLTAE